MPPILLLLAAHLLLIVKLDVSPVIMRIASMLIPLPFGFALAWVAHLGWRMAAAVGVVIGVVAVAGMTTIIGYTDNVPIMPHNFREWRETTEYAVSIALATLTGNILATMALNILPKQVAGRGQPSAMAIRIAMLISPHVGKQAAPARGEGRRPDENRGLRRRRGGLGRGHGLHRCPCLDRRVTPTPDCPRPLA